MTEKVTLKTVAEKCGVSGMSVSMALDPRKQNRLRPETRERILKTVKECGYVSNPAARRLKRQKTDAITVVMSPRVMKGPNVAPDFDAHHESISWGIIRGLITEARKQHYDIKIESLLDSGLTEDVISHIKPHLTDGVIFNGYSELEPIIEYVKNTGMPYVIIDAKKRIDCVDNSVTADRDTGVYQAFDYLINSGHSSIGFIKCQSNTSQNLLAMFRHHFFDKGIFNEELIYTVNDFFDLRNLLEGFNGTFPFTALFCFNDTAANMTVRELRYRGIKVPEDIVVIGMDGNSIYSGKGRMNLSTIKMPWEELAKEGIRTLIDLIENNQNEMSYSKIIAAEFIPGATG